MSIASRSVRLEYSTTLVVESGGAGPGTGRGSELMREAIRLHVLTNSSGWHWSALGDPMHTW
jgi:hypothetical protein